MVMPERLRAHGLLEEEVVDADQILLRVLRATAPHVEEAFFRKLTLALTTFCGVKAAAVSELLLDLDKARCLSLNVDGQEVEFGEYDLAGTPCAESMVHGSVAYGSRASQRFPQDAWLNEIRTEACVSVLLRSESDDVLGTLTILDDIPRKDVGELETLLQELAPRVAIELERQQQWAAMRREEARMRLLVQNSRDVLAYVRLKPDLAYEYVSPSVKDLTGYPAEAFHANPALATQITNPEDWERALEKMLSGSADPQVVRITRADGRTAWIETQNYYLHDEDQEVVASVSETRDITARIEDQEALRLSEQYRRALLDTMPDTLLRLSADGVILDFVPGEDVRDVLPSGTALIGQNIRGLLPTAFATSTRRLTQAALRTGKLQRVEFEVAAGHDSRFYEARCMQFGDAEVLLILRDFTAIKWHEGETERRRFRDELDQKVEQRIKTNPYGLTYRELTILHLVAEGSADKQIAETLGISIYTVNKHVGNILSKMNAASRTEAGVRGIREGLLG